MADLIDIAVQLIEKEALPRDRSQTDEEDDHQLYMSILLDGLRQPIEVWDKGDGTGYGLIAGHRRLTVYQALAKDSDRYAKIPAFIREVDTLPNAMAEMIAENEIRANVSPWDRARIIVEACNTRIFETPDAAIAALHRRADDRKRRRLRAMVTAVETFFDEFRDAHELSERRLLRLGALVRAGLEDLAKEAIKIHRPVTTDQKWQLIAPIIDEAEQVLAGAPRLKRPHQPTRQRQISKELHIRREMRKDGWALILTGPRATGVVAQQALDEVIRWLGGE